MQTLKREHSGTRKTRSIFKDVMGNFKVTETYMVEDGVKRESRNSLFKKKRKKKVYLWKYLK